MSRKSLGWPSFRRLRRRLRLTFGALPLQAIKKVKKKFEFYGITLVSSSHRRFK